MLRGEAGAALRVRVAQRGEAGAALPVRVALCGDVEAGLRVHEHQHGMWLAVEGFCARTFIQFRQRGRAF